MKRLHIITLAALLLSAVLLGVTLLVRAVGRDRTVPEITFSEEPLRLSVTEGESGLLRGVTARDEKDGDLTGQLLVQRVERSAADGGLTVTYAVADQDRHVVTKTRALVYTDYVSPRFSLKKELRYAPGENVLLRDRLTAQDVLDGSLSDRIKITANSVSSYYEGSYPVTLEVVNSLGDTASLTLDIEIRAYSAAEPRIRLTDYLVYLSEGESLVGTEYIADVTGGSSGAVRVLLPDGGLQKGVNKVTYSCTSGGVTGTATQYVVVE